MKIAAMKSLRSWKKVYGFLALVMLGSAVGPSVAMAVDFYVDATKTDDTGDGLSAPNAERNIRAAIEDAIDAGAGTHTIHVAPGEYTESGFGSGTESENFPLDIPDGVSLVSNSGPATTFIRYNAAFNSPVRFLGPIANSSTSLEGFTIENLTTWGRGVDITPSNPNQSLSATLRNNVINAWWDSIWISGSSSGNVNVTLDSNTLDTSAGYGVEATASSDSRVNLIMTGNTIDGTGSTGVDLSAGTGEIALTMDEDEILNTSNSGIYAYASYNGIINGTLDQVTIDNVSSDGIYLSADYNGSKIDFDLTNSTVTNNGGTGIQASASTSGSTINLSLDETDVEDNSSEGVYLYSYYNAHMNFEFSNGSISGNDNEGFSASGDSTATTLDVTISNATIEDNGEDGIWFSASSGVRLNATLDNLTVDDNGDDGIYLYADTGSTATLNVSNTELTNNSGDGLEINATDSTVVNVNLDTVTITGNSSDGIYASGYYEQGTVNLNVDNSTISENGAYGVYLTASSSGMVNSTLTNTSVNENYSGGLYIFASSTGSTIKSLLDRVTIAGNTGDGVEAANSWYGSRVELTARNSSITGNDGDGIDLSASGYMGLAALVENTNVSENNGNGIYNYNYYAANDLTVRQSTITGNDSTGLSFYAATYGYCEAKLERNRISENDGDGVYGYANNYGTLLLSLERNTLSSNVNQGLYLTGYSEGGVVADLGGGDGLPTPASEGLNSFINNNPGAEQVYVGWYAGEVPAQNNWWPVNTPALGNEFVDQDTDDATIVIPANRTTLGFDVSEPADRMIGVGETFTLTAATNTFFVDNVGAGPQRISVKVGGAEASDVVVAPDGKSLSGNMTMGALLASYDITVTNPAGQSGTLQGALNSEGQSTPALSESVQSARAFPNPVQFGSGATGLHVDGIPAGTHARLYTFSGELVRDVMVDATGSFVWDGTNDGASKVASGTYLLLLEANGEKKTLKIGVER